MPGSSLGVNDKMIDESVLDIPQCKIVKCDLPALTDFKA
jgi:hypothetical protein